MSRTSTNSSEDEIENMNYFYDDIVHVLQNMKKKLCYNLSGRLEVCKNFIMVKSDLRLNLKIILSK